MSEPIATVGEISQGGEENTVVVRNLTFSFPTSDVIVDNFSLILPRGSRALLCGANGAGKTTLLQILGGKYMVAKDTVRILGRPAFHDLQLVSSGDVSFLGPTWRRDIAFAGNNVALQGDISAGKMIFGVENVDPARRERLIRLLDIDLDWRLNKVSDGQRRRVQIAMGLLKPYKVLLLDEITVDMDVVGRLDLLKFFEEECSERGATIIYATHIFDGMEKWATHIAYLESGKMIRGGSVDQVRELNSDLKLLNIVEAWLREEKENRKTRTKTTSKPSIPLMPSKHMAFYR
ncbi:ABC transporter I family member 21 [Picochlorum sp. SENEW3]|nr:ABC transporter I family member 21 [Picochlorum sp. SENEW3]